MFGNFVITYYPYLLDEIIKHICTGHCRHVIHYIYSTYDINMAVFNLPLNWIQFLLQVVQSWLLSDALCDAWVASDVMACTASILNLTAISVDRLVLIPCI